MSEQFVSEPLKPVFAGESQRAMEPGAPLMPSAFVWREREYPVNLVLETWKETGPCRSSAHEQYLRKHWYRIVSRDGLVMTVYFLRQPSGAKRGAARWFLYTISEPDDME